MKIVDRYMSESKEMKEEEDSRFFMVNTVCLLAKWQGRETSRNNKICEKTILFL